MRILDRAQISLKPDVVVHASNPSTQEKRHVNRCETEVSLVRRASSGPGKARASNWKPTQTKSRQDKTKPQTTTATTTRAKYQTIRDLPVTWNDRHICGFGAEGGDHLSTSLLYYRSGAGWLTGGCVVRTPMITKQRDLLSITCSLFCNGTRATRTCTCNVISLQNF